MSVIPFVGGSISEIFGAIVTPPIEKRRNEWMKMVVEELNSINNKDESRVAEILENEDFQSLLISSSIIAYKTYQSEKKNILKNGLFNSLRFKDRYDINQQFINFIDELSLSHLTILKFINDFQERIISVNSIQKLFYILTKGPIVNTISQIDNIEITAFRYMLKDLESKGLIMLSDHLLDLENQVYESSFLKLDENETIKLPFIRITQFGIDFINFIKK
ncbi:MAG: hypothetical protein K8R58_08170 [Bacteroidales bacterium]|nr:hypothetical protein [Bacteroidales bacterium]